MQLRKIKILFGIIGATFLIVSIVLIVKYDPEKVKIFPPCVFHSITGLYCPGCGMTRAIHALLNGEILKAVNFNPLFFLFLPLFFYMGTIQIKSLIKTGKITNIRINYHIIRLIVLIVVLFWILRNINSYPFIYLAP